VSYFRSGSGYGYYGAGGFTETFLGLVGLKEFIRYLDEHCLKPDNIDVDLDNECEKVVDSCGK